MESRAGTQRSARNVHLIYCRRALPNPDCVCRGRNRRKRVMDIHSNVRIGPFEVFYPVQPAASQARLYGQDHFPGRLFIVEGIDGSGKSTQLSLLHKWIESKGSGVVFSEWNSSALVKDTTKLGKM